MASLTVLTEVEAWDSRRRALAKSWNYASAAENQVLQAWQQRLDGLRRERDELVEAGRWKAGPRTFLAATGLQYRELVLTAGLGWLLRPDGHHGMGAAMLAAFGERVGVSAESVEQVHIVREECRRDTRADLVVYGRDWTLVVEAKTFAQEQPGQLDRLVAEWGAEPGARFVFLTRGRRTPSSAVSSSKQWVNVTWREVAVLARAVAAASSAVSAGAREYLATLEAYHDV